MRRRAFTRVAMVLAASALFDVRWPEPEPVTDAEHVGRLLETAELNEILKEGYQEMIEQTVARQSAFLARYQSSNVRGRPFVFPVRVE